MSGGGRDDDDAANGFKPKPRADSAATPQPGADHAQQHHGADAAHQVTKPGAGTLVAPGGGIGGLFTRPVYNQTLTYEPRMPSAPVEPLHGPGETPQVAVTLPPDFERCNPQLIVNQLRSVIEPAQAAAIDAACAAKDLPRARQLLRDALGSIAARVNVTGDAVALDQLKRAGRAGHTWEAVKLFFAAAQRLRGLEKTQGMPSTATRPTAPAAQTLTLAPSAVEDAQRGISRQPSVASVEDEQRGISRRPSAASVEVTTLAAAPVAAPSKKATASEPAAPILVVGAPAKISLVDAAQAVTDRAGYAHLVFSSSSLPVHAAVASLSAVMDNLANVAQVHGTRSNAENAALQAAWRAALAVANELALRRPGGPLEGSIRRHINAVEAVLQEVTAGAHAGIAPSTLAAIAQQNVQALQRTVVMVATLQTTVALQAAFARQTTSTQLSTIALTAEIATTTAWIDELKGPHGNVAAPRLTVAIEAQAATIVAATAELAEVLNTPITATTGTIIAAYVKVIAAAGRRRGTVASLLARARRLRQRQPLDAVNVALAADAAQVNDIASQSASGGRSANAKLRGLAAREADLEQQIADGKQVAPQVVDQLAADVRESEFLHRIASLRMQAGQLAHAMHEMDSGVKSVVLSAQHGRIADELALLGGDMRSIAHQYKKQRNAVGPAADSAAKLRVQREALRAMEAALQMRLRANKFEQTLTAAAKQMKNSATRLFAFQLVTMIVVTLAGQWGAAAMEGATSAAMLAGAEVVAYTEEGAAIYSLGTLASVGRASWAAGRIAEMGINVAGQKALGDKGRISTLIVVNVLTPVVISGLMKPFSQLGALRGLSKADVVAMKSEMAAPTTMARASGALRGASSLTVSMVAGAGVDYATRMAMDHRAASPTDQTVTEWFLQGAAMAVGAHLTVHVPPLATRLQALKRGRNGTADLDALLARTTALQHATAELAHATPERANASLGEFAKLLEATNALTPAQAHEPAIAVGAEHHQSRTSAKPDEHLAKNDHTDAKRANAQPSKVKAPSTVHESSTSPAPQSRAALRRAVEAKYGGIVAKFKANIPTEHPEYLELIVEFKALKPGELSGNSKESKARAKALLNKWTDISTKIAKRTGHDESALRELYNSVEKQDFPLWFEQLKNRTIEEQARLAHLYREELKLMVRDLMSDRNSKEVLYLRDLALYGHRAGPKFEDMVELSLAKMTKDGLPQDATKAHEEIIGSSQQSNKDVNKAIIGNEAGVSAPASSTSVEGLKRETVVTFTIGEPPSSGPARAAFLENPANWKPERRALHEQLLTAAKAEALKFADAMQASGAESTLYAMRGNTAAGKSRTAKSAIPELAGAVKATGDNRSVNPDNFKVALMTADGGSLTSAQVHFESAMLSTRLQRELATMKTSDGKQAASIMIDKRLATLEEVQGYASIAKQTGRRFAVYDVDAPLEVSLAGVLERIPGGNDPLPEFQVVADGFRNVRRDRQAVIDYFVANPEIGSYELFATNPSGEKIKVASVLGGNVHILEPSMFVVATQKIDGIADAFGKTVITGRSIQQSTDLLPADRAKQVRAILKKHIGKTWREALDAHSREKGIRS